MMKLKCLFLFSFVFLSLRADAFKISYPVECFESNVFLEEDIKNLEKKYPTHLDSNVRFFKCFCLMNDGTYQSFFYRMNSKKIRPRFKPRFKIENKILFVYVVNVEDGRYLDQQVLYSPISQEQDGS